MIKSLGYPAEIAYQNGNADAGRGADPNPVNGDATLFHKDDYNGKALSARRGEKRYQGPDRRKKPTPFLSRYSFFGGKRYVHRRDGEGACSYVDLYSQRLTIFLLIFFVLTVIDSVSTLVYINKGGRELNPVAQWMIDQGDMFFILCKGILTGICILFVMIHKNFRYSRLAIFIGFSFYFMLTIYHIVLQVRAMN